MMFYCLAKDVAYRNFIESIFYTSGTFHVYYVILTVCFYIGSLVILTRYSPGAAAPVADTRNIRTPCR